MNKTAQQGVFFESPNEYYHSSVTSFDPATGKVNTAWWEYDSVTGDTWMELASDTPLVQFDVYPCAMDLNFASGRGGLYMASKDPRTWTVGTFISKDPNTDEITLSIDDGNGGTTQVTAPFVSPSIQAPFFIPNPLFSVRDDIADWMANN